MSYGDADIIPASFSCSFCGETNDTFIDPSQGESQSYVEDCQICCRPNILNVFKHSDEFIIEAEQEY